MEIADIVEEAVCFIGDFNKTKAFREFRVRGIERLKSIERVNRELRTKEKE
jgi:hypothetical protein